MPLTILVAAFVVPIVGWVAGQFANEQLMLEARERETDRRIVGSLVERGWQRFPNPASTKERGLPSAERGIEWLAASTSISMELGHGMVIAQPPPEAKLLDAMEVLKTELARYPSAGLRAIGFRRILACAGLQEQGQAIPSLPNVYGSLLIDVDAPATYLRRLLHHEVYHFIDFVDDGLLLRDPRWAALNVPGFEYGDGGRAMRQRGSARLTADIPGFVTAYATSAVEEDKAETFAAVMMFPLAASQMASHDPILRRKINALREGISARFPAFGPTFWSSVLGDRS